MAKSWTEKDIYESLDNIIKFTGQNYFPTHSEMIDFYKSNALAIQVSRKGGTRFWANKMGLKIKNCESELGNDFELIAIDDIKKQIGLNSVQTKPRYPYDLYTNDLVKIDVKVATPIKDRNFDVWSFNLEKKQPTCDIYIFYCVTNDKEIVKKLIIPACVLSGVKQVGIGSLSKYDNYIERWDLIKDYNDFLIKVKNLIPFISKRRTCSN